MSFCNAVINHDNCDFDTNCGLTCDQVYQRELLNNPGFVPPPGHYEDFMAGCAAFYFPDGCPDGSIGSSSSGEGCSNIALIPATVDSVIVAFTDGFKGGILTFLPFVAMAVAVIIVIFILNYSISKT